MTTQQFPLLQAKELVVPFHEIKPRAAHPAWVSRFLRERLLPAVGPEHLPFPAKRLYVSRAGAEWRKVVNEETLLELLTPLGFVRTTLEGLSVRQQAALFSQANIIVAPHGAALANLVFSPPGAKVIELQPRKLQDCYFRLCRTNGLDYYYIKSSTGPEHPINNHQDLTVLPADLTQALIWAGLLPA